jgi:prolipoprotein diacylglyceryltransferase
MIGFILGLLKKILKIPIKIALFPIKTLIASLVFYAVILTLIGGGIYYVFLL